MRHHRGPRRRGINRVEAAAAVALSCIALCLMSCGVLSSRNSADRIVCVNNLRQLGIALHSVQDAKGRFPTEHGSHPSFYKPVLPYMEQAGAEDNRPIEEFLCPSRRNPTTAPGKRDYGYASSGDGIAGASVLGTPEGLTLDDVTNKNGTSNILLLSHLWLDPKHYSGGDPTDLGWATKNNRRLINNAAKPDSDATGSNQYIGGPHPDTIPSLFADAHVANLPYTFAQWPQIWAWAIKEPDMNLP
jgi:hypothetical protein